MTEYIKRSDAIMAITRAKLPDKTPEGIPIANGKRSVTDCVRRLKEIRSEDVVHVVRCKDCHHIHIGKDVYYCRYWERWGITPNGFCSSGAKMDGEQ